MSDDVNSSGGNGEDQDVQESTATQPASSGTEHLPSSGAERNDDTSGGDPEIVSPR